MDKSQLVKRIESFLWRAGVLAAVAVVSYASQVYMGWGLPVYLQAVLGLSLGELTKYLNTVSQA